MEQQTEIYEHYKTEIYRIGWRVQYQARKIRNRERSFNDNEPSYSNFATETEEKMWVRQLLDTLPSQGKSIIEKIYLQGLTEVEVAKQLNISQQAVNKWKRKMLAQLSLIAK